MTKHNKKRNVGIIYELLLRHISNCIIENRKHDVKKATSIIEVRFKKGTELYKEFRLFNALAKANITKTEIAAAIISEAKHAAKRINVKKLNKEKSSLIKDINYKINDSKFYYRRLPNYAEYATIQTLLNEWRKGDMSDLKRLVQFENKAIEWLLTEKHEKDYKTIGEDLKQKDSNELVYKLMTEKINNKYKTMHADQKDIIKAYAFYSNSDTNKLTEILEEKKMMCLNELSKFEKLNENKFVNSKIESVRAKIQNLNIKEVNDSEIVKFLTVTKLIKEFKS